MNLSTLFAKQNLTKSLGATGAIGGIIYSVMKHKKMSTSAFIVLGAALAGAAIGYAVQKS